MVEAHEAGLCTKCRHVAVIRSDRGSIFLRCERAKSDPTYPKYPRLPVVRCPGWEKRGTPDATL